MTELIGRSYELNLGGTLIREHDMAFEVERSLSREHNTATITVFNLPKRKRDGLSTDEDVPTSLRAGYGNRLETLFVGDMTNVQHVRDGGDWVTTIESGDGANAIRRSRVALSFRKGAKIKDVLTAAAKEVGADIGNVILKGKEGGIKGIADNVEEFLAGRVLSGSAYDNLEEIADSLGYRTSIQDGAIQLLGDDETSSNEVAALLSPSTGLIGSPVRAEKRRIELRSLLRRGLLPGRKVKVESRDVNAFFRIEKGQYSGSTDQDDWFADLEVKQL